MRLSTLSLLASLTACGASQSNKASETLSASTNAPTAISANIATNSTIASVAPANSQIISTSPTPSVTPSETPTAIPSIEPTPIVTNAANGNVGANSNLAVVDPNDTNPNHLSRDPVTGLLDFRYGSFVVGGSGKADSRNYDGCLVLTGSQGANNPGYLHGSFIFQYDKTVQTLANGMISWTGAGDVTYTPGTIIATTMLYPDGTGSMTWYRPATATTPSCYSFYSSIQVDVN